MDKEKLLHIKEDGEYILLEVSQAVKVKRSKFGKKITFYYPTKFFRNNAFEDLKKNFVKGSKIKK